mmetsp:Transcript_26049/g.65647  ORF Transcript_26049/g.65647 Transcript_26049/m.65647 type:complete len:250 (-) Transcript_26049:1210-1959(-)
MACIACGTASPTNADTSFCWPPPLRFRSLGSSLGMENCTFTLSRSNFLGMPRTDASRHCKSITLCRLRFGATDPLLLLCFTGDFKASAGTIQRMLGTSSIVLIGIIFIVFTLTATSPPFTSPSSWVNGIATSRPPWIASSPTCSFTFPSLSSLLMSWSKSSRFRNCRLLNMKKSYTAGGCLLYPGFFGSESSQIGFNVAGTVRERKVRAPIFAIAYGSDVACPKKLKSLANRLCARCSCSRSTASGRGE